MVDEKVLIFEVECRSDNNYGNHHVYRYCIAYCSPISFYLVHHSQSHQHENSCSCSHTVDPSRKRLQIAGIDDGWPNDYYWQVSLPFLN